MTSTTVNFERRDGPQTKKLQGTSKSRDSTSFRTHLFTTELSIMMTFQSKLLYGIEKIQLFWRKTTPNSRLPYATGRSCPAFFVDQKPDRAKQFHSVSVRIYSGRSNTSPCLAEHKADR